MTEVDQLVEEMNPLWETQGEHRSVMERWLMSYVICSSNEIGCFVWFIQGIFPSAFIMASQLLPTLLYPLPETRPQQG